MFIGDVPQGAAILYAGIAALVGVLFTIILQQWNRRGDKKLAGEKENISARVADTEAALRAWDKINVFQAGQIQLLTARVDELQKRVDNYEESIIPQMQEVIDRLRGTVNEKQAVVDQQQTKIGELLQHIETYIRGDKNVE